MLGGGRHRHAVRAGAEDVHGLVRQPGQVLRRPVVPQSRRPVEHGLHIGVRHVTGQLHLVRQREQRFGELAQLVLAAGVGQQGRAQRCAHQLGRCELLGRAGEVQRRAAHLVRTGADDLAEGAEHVRSDVGQEQQQDDRELRQLVQPQGERGGDAEVAAPAVQRPEQLGVLVGARVHPLGVGGHQLHGDEVVDGEAEGAVQPAGAAAEDEAADAGGGGPPAGGRQTVRLGGAVQVAHRGAALDADRLCRRVHGHLVHPAQVHHERAVAQRRTGHAVAAAAHRDVQVQLPAEAHGPHHVGRVRALRDHRGPPVDHRVEDRAGLLVTQVPGGEHIADQVLAQRGEGRARLREGSHGRPLPERGICPVPA